MAQTNPIFDNETKGWVDLVPARQSQPKLTSNLEAKWLVIGVRLYRSFLCKKASRD